MRIVHERYKKGSAKKMEAAQEFHSIFEEAVSSTANSPAPTKSCTAAENLSHS
jgi:hypothetical protein